MAYLSILGLYVITAQVQTLAWVFSANLLYYYGGNAVEAIKGKQ